MRQGYPVGFLISFYCDEIFVLCISSFLQNCGFFSHSQTMFVFSCCFRSCWFQLRINKFDYVLFSERNKILQTYPDMTGYDMKAYGDIQKTMHRVKHFNYAIIYAQAYSLAFLLIKLSAIFSSGHIINLV